MLEYKVKKTNYYDYAIDIIAEKIDNRDTIQKIIEDIRAASLEGGIAFYPCSKFFRRIIAEIKINAPEIMGKIAGVFDNTRNADSGGIATYHISELDNIKSNISLLVIASNNFPSKEFRDIKAFTNYNGRIREASYFDTSLSKNLSADEILSKINEVYTSLEDNKSKMAYLTVWLYSLLKDESLSYLFEREKKIDITEDIIDYKRFTIKGFGRNTSDIENLYLEVYKMKYLYPERGDTVFDVGAYIGDTAMFFASYVGEEGKVYSFEPILANYNTLVKNIKFNKLDDILTAVNSGCGEKTEIMKGVSVPGGASWAFLTREDGDENVNVFSIDDFVHSNNIDKVDLIKMDVEGDERSVILGAREVINKYRPKMVICLYHKTEDLIILPLLMKEFGGYKLYIRSTKGGPFGTILFCVPRGSHNGNDPRRESKGS